MNVHWTDNAVEHLQGIYDYIAQTSARYALRMVDRLTRRTQQIADFPMSGRITPEINLPQIREMIEGSYRIIYFIKPDQIDVLAVVHSAQESPLKDFWQS